VCIALVAAKDIESLNMQDWQLLTVSRGLWILSLAFVERFFVSESLTSKWINSSSDKAAFEVDLCDSLIKTANILRIILLRVIQNVMIYVVLIDLTLFSYYPSTWRLGHIIKKCAEQMAETLHLTKLQHTLQYLFYFISCSFNTKLSFIFLGIPFTPFLRQFQALMN